MYNWAQSSRLSYQRKTVQREKEWESEFQIDHREGTNGKYLPSLALAVTWHKPAVTWEEESWPEECPGSDCFE